MLKRLIIILILFFLFSCTQQDSIDLSGAVDKIAVDKDSKPIGLILKVEKNHKFDDGTTKNACLVQKNTKTIEWISINEITPKDKAVFPPEIIKEFTISKKTIEGLELTWKTAKCGISYAVLSEAKEPLTATYMLTVRKGTTTEQAKKLLKEFSKTLKGKAVIEISVFPEDNLEEVVMVFRKDPAQGEKYEEPVVWK